MSSSRSKALREVRLEPFSASPAGPTSAATAVDPGAPLNSRRRTSPLPLTAPAESRPRCPRVVSAVPPPWRPNGRASPAPPPRRMPRILPGRVFSRRPTANSPQPGSRPTIPRTPPIHTPRTANPRLPSSEPASVADDIHTTRRFSAAALAGPASSGRSGERVGPRPGSTGRRQEPGVRPSSRRVGGGVRRRSAAGDPE